MNKLFEQIIKFGFVGGLCFLIDFVISTALFHFIINITTRNIATLISGFVGFTISVVVNYILSMKYVFVRKDDMDRKKEFVIFVVLSVIGLVITELILLAFSTIYSANSQLSSMFSSTLWFASSRVFATAVVMVYNFITRKIFLEKKD